MSATVPFLWFDGQAEQAAASCVPNQAMLGMDTLDVAALRAAADAG